MANYRGVKLCKAKGQYTENTTATVHTFMNRIYRSLHTISHFPLLLSFFFNIYCRCWDSDFVQLLNLVFQYGLESYTWPWRRCRLFHSKTLLMERAERFNSFRNQWEGLQSHFPLTIFLYNPSLPHEGTALGKSFSLLFITDVNTASLVERSLTVAILYTSSVSVMLECWQNLSKLTNQRVYQILVYQNGLLLSLPTGILLPPLAAFFKIFFTCCFPCCALTNWTPGRGWEKINFKAYICMCTNWRTKLGFS